MKDFALVLDAPVKAAVKSVAMALMLRAGPEGTAFASYERLAADTGLSRATVARALAALLAAGGLTVVKPGNKRARIATVYAIDPGAIQSHAETINRSFQSQAETETGAIKSQPEPIQSQAETPTSPTQLGNTKTAPRDGGAPAGGSGVSAAAAATGGDRLLAELRAWDPSVTAARISGQLDVAGRMLDHAGFVNGTRSKCLTLLVAAWRARGTPPVDALRCALEGMEHARNRPALLQYRLRALSEDRTRPTRKEALR